MPVIGNLFKPNNLTHMKIFLEASLVIFIALLFLCTNGKAQAKMYAPDTNSPGDSTMTKVEIEASFPGGAAAWQKYITKQIESYTGGFRKKDFGTCIVKFVVDQHGKPSDVEATTMKKSRLAKVAVEAIENGPKWIPAQQNGKFVNAYRLQPVTISQ